MRRSNSKSLFLQTAGDELVGRCFWRRFLLCRVDSGLASHIRSGPAAVGTLRDGVRLSTTGLRRPTTTTDGNNE